MVSFPHFATSARPCDTSSVRLKGKELLTAGDCTYRLARSAIEDHGPTPDSVGALREALATLRSAMDWLEDSVDFEAAHQLLDEAGSFSRTQATEGCELSYDGSLYLQTCPVALAHNRVGFSPTMVVHEADCSICEAPIDDCSHVPGVTYGDVQCFRVIKHFDILDITLVGRPAQPIARIHEISYSPSELAESLGEAFYPGISVMCDQCLSPCDGVTRSFEDD